VKELDLSRLDSCLLDEDADVRELSVKLKGGTVHFRLRPLTDSERSLARAESSTGESVTTWEATPSALTRYAEEIGKPVKKLTVKEVLEAGRKYGNKSIRDSMDYEKFNALMVFYALGGLRKLGPEGWDLLTKEGAELPVAVDTVRGRLNPVVLDELAAMVGNRSEVSEADAKN